MYNVGYSAKNIQIGSSGQKYTRVVVRNPYTQEEFVAGNPEGSTLVAECPWASQDLASSLLAKFSRTKYQSYVATDAIIPPTAELGDRITIAGVSSGIFNKDLKFGPLMTSTVSAPREEELDHEFEYVARVDRERIRQNRYYTGALKKVSKDADEKILEARKDIVAALNREDGAPKDLMAGFDSYVRWDLENNEGFASSQLFAQIGEKARAEIGVYAVESNGETKTLAQILADQISVMSKVNSTTAGLDTKVSNKDLSNTLKNYALASALNNYLSINAAAEMYVTSEGVTSIIGNYIVTDKDGTKKSLAQILADQILLQGRVDLTGVLSVANGMITSTGQIITQKNIRANTGLSSTKLELDTENFVMAGKSYTPTQITSTSGTVLVLGTA